MVKKALLILLVVLIGCALEQTVCINDKCFNVEYAKTMDEQAKGLMYIESMSKNSGMLFIYDNEQVRSFWMKNTLIPLDMIWIDSDNKIVHIKNNAKPCYENECPSINPNAKSQYVLEINGGLSEKYGFKVGDKVEIN